MAFHFVHPAGSLCLSQIQMESFLHNAHPRERIALKAQECPRRERLGVRESPPHPWQVTVHHRANPILTAGDVSLQTLSLAGEALQRVKFCWRQVQFVQLLGVNEGHLGQSDSINAVALDRTPQVTTECSYLLPLSPH